MIQNSSCVFVCTCFSESSWHVADLPTPQLSKAKKGAQGAGMNMIDKVKQMHHQRPRSDIRRSGSVPELSDAKVSCERLWKLMTQFPVCSAKQEFYTRSWTAGETRVGGYFGASHSALWCDRYWWYWRGCAVHNISTGWSWLAGKQEFDEKVNWLYCYDILFKNTLNRFKKMSMYLCILRMK